MDKNMDFTDLTRKLADDLNALGNLNRNEDFGKSFVRIKQYQVNYSWKKEYLLEEKEICEGYLAFNDEALAKALLEFISEMSIPVEEGRGKGEAAVVLQRCVWLCVTYTWLLFLDSLDTFDINLNKQVLQESIRQTALRGIQYLACCDNDIRKYTEELEIELAKYSGIVVDYVPEEQNLSFAEKVGCMESGLAAMLAALNYSMWINFGCKPENLLVAEIKKNMASRGIGRYKADGAMEDIISYLTNRTYVSENKYYRINQLTSNKLVSEDIAYFKNLVIKYSDKKLRSAPLIVKCTLKEKAGKIIGSKNYKVYEPDKTEGNSEYILIIGFATVGQGLYNGYWVATRFTGDDYGKLFLLSFETLKDFDLYCLEEIEQLSENESIFEPGEKFEKVESIDCELKNSSFVFATYFAHPEDDENKVIQVNAVSFRAPFPGVYDVCLALYKSLKKDAASLEDKNKIYSKRIRIRAAGYYTFSFISDDVLASSGDVRINYPVFNHKAAVEVRISVSDDSMKKFSMPMQYVPVDILKDKEKTAWVCCSGFDLDPLSIQETNYKSHKKEPDNDFSFLPLQLHYVLNNTEILPTSECNNENSTSGVQS